jgi:hypothetical protein
VPDMFPSSKFPTRFVARHKDRLTRKRAQIMDVKRYEMSTEERIRDFHKTLQAMRGRVPDQIWNCDETGFCPQGRKPPRVICRKGMHANVLRSKDRNNVYGMACVSAAGERLPPMFIFPGKKRQLEWMEGATDGAVCAVSNSSYINGFLFIQWLKFFDEQLTKRHIPRPALLVLDGHFSHINGVVLEYAVSHSIDLFVLPAHTIHFTQPLDDKVFSTLKLRRNGAFKSSVKRGLRHIERRRRPLQRGSSTLHEGHRVCITLVTAYFVSDTAWLVHHVTWTCLRRRRFSSKACSASSSSFCL